MLLVSRVEFVYGNDIAYFEVFSPSLNLIMQCYRFDLLLR